MKTTSSKLQKAGIRALAALAVIFGTYYTISAQGSAFGTKFSDNGELASTEIIKATNAFSVKSEASAEMEYFAEILEVENESELAVETWMTEAAIFGVKEMETDIEEVLKIEDWMIEDLLFDAENSNNNAKESGKVIVDNNGKTIGIVFPEAQFGRRTFILVEMEDEKMELEHWMVDPQVWVRK